MATDRSLLMASGDPGPRDDAQLFRREGEYWTLVFDGTTCRLRDVRGLQHLALLLSQPHEPISALVLEQSGVDPKDADKVGPSGCTIRVSGPASTSPAPSPRR